MRTVLFFNSMNKFDLMTDTRRLEKKNVLRYLDERRSYIVEQLDTIPLSDEETLEVWEAKYDVNKELISHFSKF